MYQTIEEGQKKAKEVIEDIKTCMFTTTDDDCNVFSRPMFTVKIDNECNLWYFTNESSNRIKDISPGKNVTLVFSHPGKNAYMNVYGNCELVHDRNKMKELWQPALKAWFPEGAEDPLVCLLKVTIDEAFYWDNSANDMICVYKKEAQHSLPIARRMNSFVPQSSVW